ncbi:MAG TPA: ligase-associated DNA damage response endonuclease PdeM [Devosiaceae bacterium]
MSAQNAAKIGEAEDADTVVVRFRGHAFEPLTSGALFWPAHEALLVADLHLEKMSSFARAGRLLPPYDTGMTLSRLEADIERTGARRVIALGDSFHRDEGTTSLLPHDRARIDRMLERTRWTWISGNHDPSPHGIGGDCCAELLLDGLRLVHEPQRRSAGIVAGHLHPAARVLINGRSVRRACFVHDERLMLLPAYGSATGSLNVLSPAFSGLFDRAGLQVVMLGRDRLYPVSPRRLVAG